MSSSLPRFAARKPNESVAVSAGTCVPASTSPAGVNAALDCTMGDDAPLVLSMTAQASA